MAKAISKNVARLYAMMVINGLWDISQVPAEYRTYVDIYIEQMRKGGK
jgi:hypothetical protein